MNCCATNQIAVHACRRGAQGSARAWTPIESLPVQGATVVRTDKGDSDGILEVSIEPDTGRSRQRSVGTPTLPRRGLLRHPTAAPRASHPDPACPSPEGIRSRCWVIYAEFRQYARASVAPTGSGISARRGSPDPGRSPEITFPAPSTALLALRRPRNPSRALHPGSPWRILLLFRTALAIPRLLLRVPVGSLDGSPPNGYCISRSWRRRCHVAG